MLKMPYPVEHYDDLYRLLEELVDKVNDLEKENEDLQRQIDQQSDIEALEERVMDLENAIEDLDMD